MVHSSAHDLSRQKFRSFSDQEHKTWAMLYRGLDENRKNLAFPLFSEGLQALGFTEGRIPNVDTINERLKKITGWRGVPVEGLEGGNSFYPGLTRREFPIGNFIRNLDVLGYTPAPDVFHDFYGHIPYFANNEISDFLVKYGEMVTRHLDHPERLKCFERFFWFTFEFALIETPNGRRIFGSGLLSSKEESLFALSKEPEVKPFDIKSIISQDYKIDEFQKSIYVLKSLDQLLGCLGALEDAVVSSVS